MSVREQCQRERVLHFSIFAVFSYGCRRDKNCPKYWSIKTTNVIYSGVSSAKDMLMDRLFSFFIIPCVLFLLIFAWLGRVTAGPEKEDKIHTCPSPPPLTQDQPVTVISTGPVVTHRHGVEPLSDTVCVPDESGQQIKCSGVEEPTRIRCQSANERVLAIQPDALTVVNDTMVRCPQTGETGNNSRRCRAGNHRCIH